MFNTEHYRPQLPDSLRTTRNVIIEAAQTRTGGPTDAPCDDAFIEPGSLECQTVGRTVSVGIAAGHPPVETTDLLSYTAGETVIIPAIRECQHVSIDPFTVS